MSVSSLRADAFFGPLRGKAVAFVLDSRLANLLFARALVDFLAHTGDSCEIFDVDAFYASNSLEIFGTSAEGAGNAIQIRVPGPDSNVEKEFPKILGSDRRVIVIDSLNSLYHFLSLDDARSRSRKLSLAIASLSYAARARGAAAIITMYRRDGLPTGRTGGSISDMADATVSVLTSESDLTLICERGSLWPGGLSIHTPSGLPS